MRIFPAIDLVRGQAVRLLRGDYDRMTVYGDPVEKALQFVRDGAEQIHLVDLEGARDGNMPNFDTVRRIRAESGVFCEIGGGIRSLEAIGRYLSAGLDQVILGTAALEGDFLTEALKRYPGRVAVGVDIRDGIVAVKGWREQSGVRADDFLPSLAKMGVRRVICTDISRDGALGGTNREWYRQLNETLNMEIVASGGVSTLEDIAALRDLGMYGAIVGKALYTGALDLKKAIETAK